MHMPNMGSQTLSAGLYPHVPLIIQTNNTHTTAHVPAHAGVMLSTSGSNKSSVTKSVRILPTRSFSPNSMEFHRKLPPMASPSPDARSIFSSFTAVSRTTDGGTLHSSGPQRFRLSKAKSDRRISIVLDRRDMHHASKDTSLRQRIRQKDLRRQTAAKEKLLKQQQLTSTNSNS